MREYPVKPNSSKLLNHYCSFSKPTITITKVQYNSVYTSMRYIYGRYILAIALIGTFGLLLLNFTAKIGGGNTSSDDKLQKGPQRDNTNNETGDIKHNSIFHFHAARCEPRHGSIAIVQMVGDLKYMETTVWNAVHSMRCYCKMRGYHLYQFDKTGKLINNVGDTVPAIGTAKECVSYTNFINKRHCLVLKMLNYYTNVVHIDADTGVVNPTRCLEDFINPEVDLHFLLRVHTNEVQIGHYVLKNTTTTKQFFSKYISGKLDFAIEQEKLQLLISETFLPADQQSKCKAEQQKSYFKMVRCIISSLRAHKSGKKRLLLYSRGQTFVRDGWANGFSWSQNDLMLHAMKRGDDRLFTRKLRAEDCENDIWVIPSKKELYVDSVQKMKEKWAAFDKVWRANTNYGLDVGIGECWPNCPHIIV